MNNHLASIKRTSATGLWGSVAVVLLAAGFTLSPYRIVPQSEATTRWMLVAGSLLAVLAVSMALMTVRKRVPQLRQSEGLESKLAGYARHVRSLYLPMLGVVALVCLLEVIASQSVLLMLAIVATLLLFLNYPNMYRVKVDLGLTDEEMRSLYGDQYIVADDK
ncbi:MAG: hypothetical protein IJU19_07665 [Bacteroidales bacterium]|nr:hypothetical protein [Bacteroidales bacterium]